MCGVGTDVPLAGAPDVSVRKIRRKEVSIGTSFNKTMGLVQVNNTHINTHPYIPL
jgi:hypothetical protein